MIKKVFNILFILFVSFCMVMPINAREYTKIESNILSNNSKNILVLTDDATTTNWRSDDEEALNQEQIRESCTDFKD